jgi:hypothetical protein
MMKTNDLDPSLYNKKIHIYKRKKHCCKVMIFHVLPDASHYAPSGSTKSSLPLKSTPTYGKSSTIKIFLLHHVKKPTVNAKDEGSFPSPG